MSQSPQVPSPKSGAKQAAKVILVSSVMFTFISYWRAAAVVLCDLASTSYYIGGIVEHSIGPAAPVFIIAVMLFSYAVRAIYIESCAMFVRGGVYRIVKEALGGMFAKLAASALMFDYILTGPISSVSAGQYIMGLLFELLKQMGWGTLDPALQASLRAWGSVLIAIVITLYFYRQNILGIHESSEKALKIMILTTIMGAIMIGWCLLTLIIEGPKNSLAFLPDYHAQAHVEGHANALGFLAGTSVGNAITQLSGVNWWSFIGFLGFFIAFGHSILAMSGEETLAQVYREVESPKLKNFQKAAFIVFLYSLILTGSISILAVLLIPTEVRMSVYADNLIGGLAMNFVGPTFLRLLLNAFVVVVGALILAGAVNTSIIGSNGVLNRIAEDGVLPDSFLKPHPRYGTTYRLLSTIVGLQLFTIIASQGDVLILGEAYAFGVVWSFVFNSLAMLILRFTRPGPREFKVPLNIRIGQTEIPVGLGIIFLILICSAVMNLLTKTLATEWGIAFTAVLFVTFTITEWIHHRNRGKQAHGQVLQFNQETQEDVTAESLKLTHQYHKLVAIRSPQNLYTLKKALAETDPETTDVIVMTAKVLAAEEQANDGALDRYDQELMTAVVEHAELAGKQVTPLVVPTNSPLFAVLKTAKELKAQEVIMGASNKFSADQQLDQLSFYWINLHQGSPPPLTVRIVSRNRDIYLDLEGGNRIPKISERQARSVAELRAAEVGVDHVVLVHDNTQSSSALFRSVITMLDPQVILDIVEVPNPEEDTHENAETKKPLLCDQEQAERIGREINCHQALLDPVNQILDLINKSGTIDLLIIGLPPTVPGTARTIVPPWVERLLPQVPCQVFLAAPPPIPNEIVG